MKTEKRRERRARRKKEDEEKMRKNEVFRLKEATVYTLMFRCLM